MQQTVTFFPRVTRLLGMAMAAPLMVAALLAGAMPAWAQNRDMQSLIDQVGRMQQDLSDLQRTVYRGGGAASGGGGGAGVQPAPADSNNQTVSNLYRLNDLERQIAELTGRIEEAQYGVQRLNDKLDKLSSDLEFRLTRLEQGAASGAAGASSSSAPQTAAAASQAANAANDDRGPKVLGTMPQNSNSSGTASANRQQSAALPSGASAQEAYDVAFQTLVRQDFPAAEQQFRGFLTQHGNSPLAGNAQYWLAETHYVRGQYEQAAVAFAEGFEKYPKNAKAPDNLLKLGLSLSALKRKDDACLALGELGKQYPNAAQNIKRRALQERQKLACS